MLKFLRKNTKVFVWIVVIAFVGWGGYAVQTQFEESNRSPGRIDGKEISFREYLRASQVVALFYAQPQNPDEIISAEQMEAQAWQFLTLSHEAKKQKIDVSDEEVRKTIIQLMGGENALELDPQQYAAFLKMRFRKGPLEFEDAVRENLRVRKLLEQVRKGFTENPDEKMKEWLTSLIQTANPEIYRSPSR